jgi:lysophospholipase L1-like esterase
MGGIMSSSPPADGSKVPKIVIIGSSVAEGQCATTHGWVDLLRTRLAGAAEVVNVSQSGCNTHSTIDRFSAVIPADADAVIVALALNNEGLPYTRSDKSMDNVAASFTGHLKHMGLMIERHGAVPIVCTPYPFGGDDASAGALNGPQYARLRTVHAEIMGWPESSNSPFRYAIDFLTATDDGEGHWSTGLSADPGHPNDAGHAAMAQAINVDELMAAVTATQLNTSSKRVLAFGDSLTAGFHNDGNSYAPWGPRLAGLIGCRVDVNGGSGKTAVDLARDVGKANAMDVCMQHYDGLAVLIDSTHVEYDCVIIMVGTNDLAMSHDTLQILQAISKLHGVCHALDIPTVCVSIPPNRFVDPVIEPKYHADWEAANFGIQAWAEAEQRCEFVAFPVPYSDGGDWEPDGLHMSPQGYAAVADALAPTVKRVLGGAQ